MATPCLPRHTPLKRVNGIIRQLHAHATSASQPSDEFVSPLTGDRSSASFPVREMTYYLDGGEGITSIKELVQASIEYDPVLNDAGKHDLSREEARRRSMAKIAQVVGVIRGRNADVAEGGGEGKVDQPLNDEDRSASRSGAGRAFEDAFYGTLGSLDPSWSIRIGVHFGLFQSAINGSGTDQQRAYYSKLMQEMRIIGCFAMTEMGHGSYLQGLETTAIYDRATQEFVIHSPTLTSTKWWIGMAGQTATHAAVFARLIIDGKDHGIQTFVVPLRTLDTGKPVENVEIGDMGSKMGRNGLDNGWIRFSHKRVPRDAMLMRWSKVSVDGKFTPPPSKQIAYNALIGTRVELFKYCSDELKKALSIAVRYSLVRRQFPRKDAPERGEVKLLDYPTHQIRLFPMIAHAYVIHFTAIEIQAICDASLRDLESNLSTLPSLHATSSGLKAIGTWYTNDQLEIARQCLGGMGYSTYSGLPGMRADFAVQCTWEGDNTVLSLQCSRFLVKSFVKLIRSQKAGQDAPILSDVTNYLARIDLANLCPDSLPDATFADPLFQLRSFQHRSKRLIQDLTASIDEEVKATGCSYAIATERLSADSLRVTRAHVYTFLLECMQRSVQKAPKELQPVLKRVSDLFALHEMQAHSADFLEDGFLRSCHLQQIRRLVRQLLTQLRPDALALVDAFNIPDFVIDSPLGRQDGDVYRALFEQVKNAPRATGVPSYYDQLIRPLTDSKYVPPPANE